MNKDKTKHKQDKQLEIFKERFNNEFDKLGISQKSFSIDTEISQSAITKYRKGEMLPNMENLEKMAKRFGVSGHYLLGENQAPTYKFEDISKKTGLSQKAIETLWKIQHHYFELYEDIEIDIEDKRKISKTYQKELKALSDIIEDNVNLIELLYSINELKEHQQKLQDLKKQYKETIRN